MYSIFCLPRFCITGFFFFGISGHQSNSACRSWHSCLQIATEGKYKIYTLIWNDWPQVRITKWYHLFRQKKYAKIFISQYHGNKTWLLYLKLSVLSQNTKSKDIFPNANWHLHSNRKGHRTSCPCFICITHNYIKRVEWVSWRHDYSLIILTLALYLTSAAQKPHQQYSKLNVC